MHETAELIADARDSTAGAVRASGRRAWLLLVDPLPNRIFFDCGIVDRLRAALDDRLTAVWLVHEKHIRPWLERSEGMPLVTREELMPFRAPFGERVVRRLDIELDKRIGFFPLAIRHSMRHGFHQGRWIPGHRNFLLDPDRIGPLPRWNFLDPLMARWYFSPRLRYVPSALLERMRAECSGLVVTNLQARVSMTPMLAARRLGLPVVGNVASWDHQVGKGVLSPGLDRYLVQNEIMRADLERYHGIDPSLVVVTGWPQSDVYHRRRPRAEYEALLARLGLDPGTPVVLYAGNTPTNQPYEASYVSRMVKWWAASGGAERFQLLFRPHPRDNQVRERFAAAFGRPGLAVQEASYTDLDDLAVLLQHVACVVANGGTILLDAVANDRPSVCIAFDAGPPGERWADLNLGGQHYRELIESDALERADDFDGLFAAVERALARPDERAAERARVSREVMGEVDGRAAERVVDAIVDALGVRAGG
ncbi:MAG TPA: CDP-glycerol glycerophosphotransferase family protein [Gaiellaceae bacterium]|nr:CDP-glycerol glycerophosphotransferase family protein [Gaiellaceae bacterium]